jgi:hypothetical protein
MVLERRVPIGLGGMARVSGLGKETEIGQIKPLHHVRALLKRSMILFPLVRRVGPRGRRQGGQDAQGKEE